MLFYLWNIPWTAQSELQFMLEQGTRQWIIFTGQNTFKCSLVSGYWVNWNICFSNSIEICFPNSIEICFPNTVEICNLQLLHWDDPEHRQLFQASVALLRSHITYWKKFIIKELPLQRISIYHIHTIIYFSWAKLN